jgi:hypothetical protein
VASVSAITETSSKKSFAQLLKESCDVQIKELLSPMIKGDSLHIKITQEEYEKGLADCCKNLYGRILWSKGNRLLTAKELCTKLCAIWQTSQPWWLVSLGRGFSEFHFESFEDMRLAWSSDTVNLKPGLLRLSKWTNDFSTATPRQTHARVLIRLMELPQEYWRQRTLFEKASAMGTPLSLDGSTKNHTFGHYARILVDMDHSRRIFDEIIVEREGFTLRIEVTYERLLEFCPHCQAIGHNIHTCKWLHPSQNLDLKPIVKTAQVAKIIKKKEYVAKARQSDTIVTENKQQNPSTSKATFKEAEVATLNASPDVIFLDNNVKPKKVAIKVMNQYTGAALLGNNNVHTPRLMLLTVILGMM